MFNDRKVVFKALVGSHNYNLNDESSDKDWKYFVLPTFDDLYGGTRFSASKVGTEEDYDVHDIRKLTDLLWKANVNFLEVLYSNDVQEFWKLTEQGVPRRLAVGSAHILREIFDIRDSIVTMNLPYLYSACKGMFHEKMKRIQSPTSGTQELMDKYGYDTKQALHAWRILDFIVRFHEFDWDFKTAMTYNETERQRMLMIKHGHFAFDEFKALAYDAYNDTFLGLEDIYKSKVPNLETKAKLEDLVKSMVHRNL